MIEPLKHRILIQRDSPKTESDGGLLIPEEGLRKETRGTVLALGKDADEQLKVGDRVIFGYHDGVEIHSNYCEGLSNCLLVPDTQIRVILND